MNNSPLPASQLSPPDETRNQPLIPTVYIVVGVVITLLISALAIILLVYLANNYAESILVIRDIFIIALGLMSCLTSIVLILLLIAVIRLVNMLEFELKPILLKTNETLGTIRGTTAFVSDNVIRPVTTASSYLAGVRRGISVLFGDPRRNLGK